MFKETLSFCFCLLNTRDYRVHSLSCRGSCEAGYGGTSFSAVGKCFLVIYMAHFVYVCILKRALQHSVAKQKFQIESPSPKSKNLVSGLSPSASAKCLAIFN